VDLAEQLGRQLTDELDFTLEARQLKAFHGMLQDRDDVRVPIALEGLTAPGVLTMTRLQGEPLSAVLASPEVLLERDAFIDKGVSIYLEMIRNGSFHADPHPGNLIVMPGGRIGILDFGMVGTLSPLVRRHLIRAAHAFSSQDARGLSRACLKLVRAPSDLDRASFEADVGALIQRFDMVPGSRVSMSALLGEAVETLRQHDLVLKSEVAILVRCVVVLEATARQLVPHFDLAAAIRGWAADPRHADWEDALDAVVQGVAQPLRDALPEGVGTLMDLPEETGMVIQQIRSGDLVVNVRLKNLDGAVHHLTSATIVAAGLLGSTIMLAAQTPPLLFGMSVLGVVGTVISSAVALVILLSIYRHHRPHR